MRRSLFAVVIMLSASGALAADPNGTAVTTDTGAMMDAAKVAVLTPEGVLATTETNVWRTVWNMSDGTPVTTSAMMDAAKRAVLMPEGAKSFADAQALWAGKEVPIMGINRRPLGLSSD